MTRIILTTMQTPRARRRERLIQRLINIALGTCMVLTAGYFVGQALRALL